uniref:Transmembrane protein 247 n=1 Tax=Anolis carolinensis TaxID=28377 RepID=A0A803T9U3_ANOCA
MRPCSLTYVSVKSSLLKTTTMQLHVSHIPSSGVQEENPENASSTADNGTEQTSAPDDLTEPPCTPNEATDPLDIRQEEAHLRTKAQLGLESLHPNTERELDSWVPIQHPSKKEGHDALAPQLKKMRLDMELTMTRYRYEDKEKQRQHKEKMEEIRLQAPSTQPSERGHSLLVPQDQLTLFLYCFIFIHIIYILKELVFFFIKKHEMFTIIFLLICVIKAFWK